MSKESDTQMAIQYKKQLIKKHISVDVCKECPNFLIAHKKLECTLDHPTVESCNLIKIFYLS